MNSEPVKKRADLGFGDAFEALAPDNWAPATHPAPAPIPEDELRAVAEASGFQSREVKPTPSRAKPSRRSARVHRTGRSFQLNMKIREEDRDRFYRMCDQEAWVLGYGFQRAIEALERELGLESDSSKSK